MSRQVYFARVLVVSTILVTACAAGGQASVVIDTVAVGCPGNIADTAAHSGNPAGQGSVAYTYNIGKYEVTAGQYCEFLNAVAGVDTYGLYNTSMWSSSAGCKIERYAGDGTSGGPYQYRVANDATGGYWANRPVNYVSYWDSSRFANWLHNGQPTGTQGPGTTERGAYMLDGYNGQDGRTIQRNPGWNWAVTSEDEWYKAAYHKNDGVTGNYWDFPMGNSEIPDNGNPAGDTGNSANFYDGDYTIGSPYWRTEVGYFGLSDSPYGTFDQGGNVWEWNDTVVREGSGISYRGMRGGSFDGYGSVIHLHAYNRTTSYYPTIESGSIGFRVSEVPEPVTIVMLLLASVGVIRRKRP